MPYFANPNDSSFAPLISNLSTMIAATHRLHSELEYVADDAVSYGALTEDTFLENCPEILKQLERITALLRSSSQSLRFGDDMFAHDVAAGAPAGLAQDVLVFLSQHAAILATLGTHVAAIRSTGPWYDSLTRSVNAQKESLVNFKAALDERFVDVKIRTQGCWREMENVVDGVVGVYPLAAHIVVVE